jgi:hypothetical protein
MVESEWGAGMSEYGFIDNGDCCHLYVIEAVGQAKLVKIGISSSPWGRISSIQTSCPFELRMAKVFTLPTRRIARDVELAVHEAFGDVRLRGEWFAVSADNAIFCVSEDIEGYFNANQAWSEEERAAKLKWCDVNPGYMEEFCCP